MDTESGSSVNQFEGDDVLPLGDYVSPGLAIVIPDAAFPNMVVGDTRVPQWLWLRKWVEHNWYTDASHPYAGFASRDEAAILYNSALKFQGRACLEIGCWRGWSAVHLALGAGSLHVIDPILDNPEFATSIRASCEAAGVLDRISFHSGFSPAAIDELSAALNLRWSLIFIDADHEGDAPRLDAEAAMRHAADDAMILFHDLASPYVAAGLDALRNAGWRTMVYQTMQIMGVAWRGDVEPVRHIPDPKVFWTLPKHLAGYEVSGWSPPSMPRRDGAWWHGMDLSDRWHQAMMRAQITEDSLVTLIKESEASSEELMRQLNSARADYRKILTEIRELESQHSSVFSESEELHAAASAQAAATRLQLEASERRLVSLDAVASRAERDRAAAAKATVYAKQVEREFSALVQRVNIKSTEHAQILAKQHEALADVLRLQAQQDTAISALAAWAARPRVLAGMLRRSGPQRSTILCHWMSSLGLRPNDMQEFVSWFTRSRVLIGLLRRSPRSREALVEQSMQRQNRHYLFGELARLSTSQVLPELAYRSLAWEWHARERVDAYTSDDAFSPYFAGVDFDTDAVLAWIKAVPSQWPLPETRDFVAASDRIRSSGVFNESYYCRQAGVRAEDIDAALHYALVGEALGLKPSENFSPRYYADRHNDILDAGGWLLEHYIEFGRKEGRRAVPPTKAHVHFELFNDALQNVIVVLHETSRTGAPILGWNIAKRLAGKYNIFTILIGDGALTTEMQNISVETHGPFSVEDRHPADLRYALEPLFEGREFQYAIVNSTESRGIIEVCARELVPTVFLVHEFGSYVHPRLELIKAFDRSDEIVFPAELVASASVAIYPQLSQRAVRILPQGMSDLPSGDVSLMPPAQAGFLRLATMKAAGVFFVLGAGSVSLRKGVDLFVAAAAATLHANPALEVHFVWIGHGYRPDRDMGYSVYLHEQVERSNLKDKVTFLDEVADLEQVYALADLFLLTSRLDPLPNVSIDAAWHGIPIVCFKEASGTAELLLRNPTTARGVVPHLDVHAAGEIIAKLAADRDLHLIMSQATAQLARDVFDMNAYVQKLDALGSELGRKAAQWRADARDISRDKGFRQEFFLGGERCFEQREKSIQRYVAKSNQGGHFSGWQRRPAPGFNPQLWRVHQAESGEYAGDPYASFVRAGKPAGLWQLPVIEHDGTVIGSSQETLRALLHVAIDDPKLLVDLVGRLGKNLSRVKLLISTDKNSRYLVEETMKSLGVEASIVSGRLDDLPRLIAYLASDQSNDFYDVIGCLSGKEGTLFPTWRDFQWENLIGGHYAMVDMVLDRFQHTPDLGLVFAAEPYVSEWDEQSLDRGKSLAVLIQTSASMNVHGYDFPESGMFWARRSVLAAVADLTRNAEARQGDLAVNSAECERLLPLVCKSIGSTVAVTYVAGTGW